MNYVVVTGSASGIGQATAHLLNRESVSVIGVDVSRPPPASTEDKVDPNIFERVVADITSGPKLAQVVERCNSRSGRLLGVVNCAGVAAVTPFADTTKSMMRNMFDVDVIGTMLVSQALSPLMIAGGGGSIVNLASVSGLVGNVCRAA